MLYNSFKVQLYVYSKKTNMELIYTCHLCHALSWSRQRNYVQAFDAIKCHLKEGRQRILFLCLFHHQWISICILILLTFIFSHLQYIFSSVPGQLPVPVQPWPAGHWPGRDRGRVRQLPQCAQHRTEGHGQGRGWGRLWPGYGQRWYVVHLTRLEVVSIVCACAVFAFCTRDICLDSEAGYILPEILFLYFSSLIHKLMVYAALFY